MEFDIWYCDSGLWWSGGRLCREGGWWPTKMVAEVPMPDCLCTHIVQWPPALRVWQLQVWCCKSVWRQVLQVWRQVWPLQGRYTRPSFNGAAAVKCFFLSSSFLFSSCVASNKNKNIIELQFSIHIFLHWCCRYGIGVG